MLKTLANEEDKDEQLDLATESSTLKRLLEADFLELYRREKRDLIQKNKLNWIKLGDVNTNLFHGFLATKKEKSIVSAEKIAKYQLLKKLLSVFKMS